MKTTKYKLSELGMLTATPEIVACWDCKAEFPLFESKAINRRVMKHGRSYWLSYAGVFCPLCKGNTSQYDNAARLAESKARRRERKQQEESEAERLHRENAGLSVKLSEAQRECQALRAEIERLNSELATKRNETPVSSHDTCQHCGKTFEQPTIGRKARFCSAGCRLHFHRATKRSGVSLLLLVCLMAAMLSGCQNETKVKITQDGANVAVSIPQDATAAELINLQTALSNTLTIKAERERMAFELAAAKLEKSERQFNTSIVCIAIVALAAIACVFVVKGGHSK